MSSVCVFVLGTEGASQTLAMLCDPAVSVLCVANRTALLLPENKLQASCRPNTQNEDLFC